jgi:hypothetical protein
METDIESSYTEIKEDDLQNMTLAQFFIKDYEKL